MKKNHPLRCLLLDWLMIILGVLGSLFCLISAFSFPYPSGLLVLIPVLALIFCLLFQGKSGKYFALGLLTLLLIFVWLLRRELIESFRNLWGELGRRFAMGYDQVIDFLPRDPTRPENILPALTCLAIGETFLCSLAVRLWKRTFPAALAMLPGIVPCFVLTDTPPDPLPLLAAVFSILTQALSQSVRRRRTGEQGKAVVLSAAFSAAILGLLLLLIPEKTYSPPISWEDLSSQMQRWGQEQSNRGNLLAGLAGNPEVVDLTELGALPNHPSTALHVRSSVDNYLYLRGSSYSEFDGTRWRRGTAEPLNKSFLFPYLQQTRGEALTIETVDPEDRLYTTYQLTQLPPNVEVISDIYVRNSGSRNRYSMRFFPYFAAVSADEQYASWVQEHDLDLPEQTRRGVLAWWEAQGGEAAPADHTLAEPTENFARKVAAAVSGCADYSRNPLPMPEDVDFCTWFLNDADEGFCVHYATACTALLRALGIPARYVSGYVCATPANKTVAVTNLQAHAWVEVWTGGRWIQIEPTPNNATEFTGLAEYGWGQPVVPVNPPETTAEVSPQAPPDETLPPLPDDTRERPTRPSKESTAATEPVGHGSGGNAKPRDLTPIWVVLGVIGSLALILGRRALALRLWENRLARAPGNERARMLYRRMLRMQRLGSGPIPGEAERLANMAGFSQHTLTDAELHDLQQIYNQQKCRLSFHGFWRKLYCKYILAII